MKGFLGFYLNTIFILKQGWLFIVQFCSWFISQFSFFGYSSNFVLQYSIFDSSSFISQYSIFDSSSYISVYVRGYAWRVFTFTVTIDIFTNLGAGRGYLFPESERCM